MAHDVFISHSAKDKVTADAVCAMLESEGVRCWIAPRDVLPSMEWGEAIIDAIEECRIMVLVFTANANDSPQIRREVERAVNHGVAILPLRIEDVLPARALEYFIGNVHWLDALTPPLEAHLRSLAGTIKIVLARMKQRNPQPQEAAVKAPPAKQPETAAVPPVEPVVVPSTSLPAEAPSREFKPPDPILVPDEDAQSLESPSTVSFAVPAEAAPVPIDPFATAQAQSAEIGPPPSVPQEASPESHVEASAPPLAPHPAEAVPREADLPGPLVAPEAVQQSVESSLMDLAADAAESTPVADDISELAEAPGVEIGHPASRPQEAPLAPAPQPGKAWISRGWTLAILGQMAALAVFFSVFKFWVDQHAGAGSAGPITLAPSLNSIFGTSDGKRLWAVGSGGTILESDDGGATWAVRDSGSVAWLSSIFGTSDGKRLWAVGTGGTILESDDGGATWMARNTGATECFNSIFGTSDGKLLWTVGDSGAIVESHDGGVTWTWHMGNTAELSSIFGTRDGKRAWAVGQIAAIVELDAGSKTVTKRSTGSTNWLSRIFGTSDGKRMWAIGDDNVARSEDGGATWVGHEAGGLYTPNSMFGTSDGKRLWAVGPGGAIAESDDAGATWTTRSSGTSEWLSSIFGTSDGKRMWIVGWNGTILESDDGGASWAARKVNP